MTTDLQTVGAMHQCKKGELYSTCIHCGAIAEKLNSPCPNFMRQVASHGQAPAGADFTTLGAAMRAIQQAIELIGDPADDRMRAVRRVLRGAVIVAEDSGDLAAPAGAAQQAPAGAAAGRFIDQPTELKSAQEGYEKRITRVSERNPRDEGMYTLGWWDRAWKAAPAAPSTPASDGWISVDERLPPSARPVLACNPCGFIGRAEFSSGRWNHIGKPSHWMPLPPLPASPTIEGESNE